VTDLKSYLELKGTSLGRWGYQLQPHVVILADDEQLNGSVSYACVHSSIFYETSSALEAVDIAFKTTFVMGL